MCGLAGLFSITGCELELTDALQRMTTAVRHRGPDDEGYALFSSSSARCLGGADTPAAAAESCLPYAPRGTLREGAQSFEAALGHRRLAILDLSVAGHQPMTTEDRRYWIVYNGEIYNQKEIRSRLEDEGEVFRSQCDTEVLLRAYRKQGPACLATLRGMFAFVIYDSVGRTVFAARDRFGIKPLYYWLSPAGFVAFASEIKQFTALPGWRAGVNGQRAYDYLNWELLDHTSETLFAGVNQLRGGEYLEFQPRSVRELPSALRWYRLVPRRFDEGFDAASARFGRLLRDSVREHLQSDVAVGSCLSGGLDSSAIVCLVRNLRSGEQDPRQLTFSACARDPRFDERAFVEEVTRATGVSGHVIYPEPQALFDSLDKVTWHQDEPFGSTSMYAQWCVFELAARHGVKVLLDGQGADEQLLGYHAYFASRQAHLARTGRWLALWKDVRAVETLHGVPAVESLAHAADAWLSRSARFSVRRFFNSHPRQNPGWLDLGRLHALPRDPYAAAGDRGKDVAARSLAQLTATSLPMLLHWEDRNSMAHSVESRVPFLDHRVVEFVLGLPEHYKISDGVTKRVLRDCMKGILPEAVRTRRDKMGFVTEEPVWVREASASFRRHVARAVEVSTGLLTPETRARAERVLEGREPFSFWLWRILNFGVWVDRFGVSL